jgi:hypothetical protein
MARLILFAYRIGRGVIKGCGMKNMTPRTQNNSGLKTMESYMTNGMRRVYFFADAEGLYTSIIMTLIPLFGRCQVNLGDSSRESSNGP